MGLLNWIKNVKAERAERKFQDELSALGFPSHMVMIYDKKREILSMGGVTIYFTDRSETNNLKGYIHIDDIEDSYAYWALRDLLGRS